MRITLYHIFKRKETHLDRVKSFSYLMNGTVEVRFVYGQTEIFHDCFVAGGEIE